MVLKCVGVWPRAKISNIAVCLEMCGGQSVIIDRCRGVPCPGLHETRYRRRGIIVWRAAADAPPRYVTRGIGRGASDTLIVATAERSLHRKYCRPCAQRACGEKRLIRQWQASMSNQSARRARLGGNAAIYAGAASARRVVSIENRPVRGSAATVMASIEQMSLSARCAWKWQMARQHVRRAFW